MNFDCKSAKDRNGERIKPGDVVLYIGYGEHILIPCKPVRVMRMYKQGADGTILVCELPPKPEHNCIYTCRASVVQKVRL